MRPRGVGKKEGSLLGNRKGEKERELGSDRVKKLPRDLSQKAEKHTQRSLLKIYHVSIEHLYKTKLINRN